MLEYILLVCGTLMSCIALPIQAFKIHRDRYNGITPFLSLIPAILYLSRAVQFHDQYYILVPDGIGGLVSVYILGQFVYFNLVLGHSGPIKNTNKIQNKYLKILMKFL